MINSKKGAEKVMSVYWFLILALVAAGVFIMVYNFYNYPYDIREIESNIMTNQIANCISTGGKLNEVVSDSNFSNDFLEVCNLNLETDEWEDEQYYLEVNIEGLTKIVYGNLNLVSSCGVEKEIEEENLAKCSERIFYAIDGGGHDILIKVLSIVRKTEKNVR